MPTQHFSDHSGRFEVVKHYFLGMTVSQPPGGVALCVVRRCKHYEYCGNPRKPVRYFRSAVYEVGYAERLPSGLTYPQIIERVGDVLNQPVYGGEVKVAINVTEVGRPLVGLCHAAKLFATGLTVTTADTEVREDQHHHRIPQARLVGNIQALLHDEKLTISKHLDGAEDLIRELANLRLHRTDSGRVRFEGLDRRKDMATALAVAVWSAMNWHETRVEELRI